jgi:hexosaminidase
MKENNLKDEHELQSYFIQRMEKYINSKGRTLIGWDEILEGGLAPNASVMSWRGESGGIAAAKQKHDVIMTPTTYVYFDYSQTQNEDSVTIGGFIDLEKVYNYEPIPEELTVDEAKYISGVQANIWTEYMTNPRKVEYMIFPRTAALCEVAWSPKEKKNWGDFEKRLQTQFKRYDLWRANYSKAYFDLRTSVIPATDNNGVLWKLESKFKDAKIEYVWGSNSLSMNYSQPVKVVKSNSCTARLYSNNKIVSSVGQDFFLNKATGKKITLSNQASENYPGDGAFTLVNGVQNEKGRGRSKEFLGFNGTDCEALIDLGNSESISFVTVHAFHQKGAWIWRPLTVEVFGSADGQSFTTLGLTDDFNEIKNGNGTMKVSFNNIPIRFIKVVVKNWGEIPQKEPGAGNKPWLFVDEIEVN